MIRRNFIKTAVAACLAPLAPLEIKSTPTLPPLYVRPFDIAASMEEYDRLTGNKELLYGVPPMVITHNVSGVALNPRKHIVFK